MSDLAGGSIAMDIKSVFDRAGFNRVISDMTSQASKAGDDMGKMLGGNLSKSVGNSASQMRAAMEQQMRSAQSAVESAMSGMVKATNSQANALSQVEIAQKRVSEVTQKYGEDSSQAMKAVLAHTKAQQGLADAQTKVLKATNDSTTAQQALVDVQAKSKRASDDHATSMAALGSAVNTAGLAIAGGFVAAVGVGIDKAAEFQTSQNRLVTSAGELTSNLKQVSDGILAMAGQVGVSAQELSAGMYTVESAGYHGADSLKVLQASAQGARMEGAELKTVADAVSTALSDYHLPADQAGKVTSQLVTAVGQGKTTMEEFSSSLHSITPLAASVGVSLADATGSLAEMTAHGMSADQASQNLADTLRHLVSPTAEMRSEFAQLHLSASDVQNSLSTNGLAGTLDMLTKKIASQSGPDGKLLLDSFNSSKEAAANLQSAINQLPPALQQMARGVVNGTTTVADWKAQVKGLPENQAHLASGFLEMYDKANGFTNALKNGSPQMQTATQAIKALMGDATGLNSTLMLTGENASATANNVKLIAGATTDAKGNVKGWDDIQTTFNQRLAEFKASIGSSAISLGNVFLPAATNVAKTLADVANWFGRNKTAAAALVITLGSIAAAFAVWKAAQGVMALQEGLIKGITIAYEALVPAQEAATGAEVGLDAAMDANPIGAVVVAVEACIAALGALALGVMYAYDHWGWFRTAVQDTWTVLKAVGEWIAHEAVAAWHAFMDVLHPVETAFKAVADAAMWLWRNAIEPAATGIGTALRVVGAVVMTVLAVPFVLAFKLIEAAVKALYSGVIQPTFKLLETIFHWLYDNVVKPVVELIKLEIQGWGEIITWIHDKVIDPVFHVIGDVWHWLYDTIIHPIVDLIKADIQAWGQVFHWLHDTVIKPVGDAIGVVMGGLKTAFKDVVDWLDQQWGRIIGIVGPPVKFIVDTVYNEGIVPTWNAIAGVFGLGPLQAVNAGNLGGGSTPSGNGGTPGGGGGVSGFAGGGVWQGPGVLPGYSPGKDSVNAVLSPGEGVAVPELVQAIGPQRFMQLNWQYSNGRKPGSGPGFDAGTIFGSIGSGIVDAGKSAVSGAMDTAKFMAKLATDPEGAVRDLFSGVLGQANTTPGNPSNWLNAIKSLPSKTVDAVIQKALAWGKSALGSGSGHESWVSGAGAEQWAPLIVQALALEGFPTTAQYVQASEAQIMTESGGNPNIIQQIQDVNSGGNEARGLVQVTPRTAQGLGLADLGGNIYDPLTNLRLGLRELKSQHGGDLLGTWGHGHGYAGGGIVGTSTKTTQKQADPTAINRAMGWLQTVVGGAYKYGSALDCSGLVSGIYQELIGGNPGQRAFTTISDFPALGFLKGTGGVFSIGVNPLPGEAGHMAAELNGHAVESSSDHGIVMDGPARRPTDPMFPVQYYLPGRLFVPAYTGIGATPSAGQTRSNKLSAAGQKYQAQAQRYTTQANNALAAAKKHDENAQKYLDDAKKAKTPKAAADYQARAKAAQDAAAKSRATAATDQQKAQDAQAKADQAEADAQAQAGNTSTSSKSKGTASSSSTGIMTFHDIGSKLGGIAADAITESFGLDNVSNIISNSRILKVGNAIENAKVGKPYLDKFFALPQQQNQTATVTPETATSQGSSPSTTTSQSDTSSDTNEPLPTADSDPSQQALGYSNASVYDNGGWLQPGDLAVNLGRRPEPILAPQHMDMLQQLALSGAKGAPDRPWVNIENITHVGGDEHTTARRIVREMNTYQPRGSR